VAIKLDRRGHGRRPVNILATLKRGKDIFSCHIVELSEAGARIKLASEFAVVEGVGHLTAAEIGDREAEIVWQKGEMVGLRFTAVKVRATGDPAAAKGEPRR
jgi:hypothetical protein